MWIFLLWLLWLLSKIQICYFIFLLSGSNVASMSSFSWWTGGPFQSMNVSFRTSCIPKPRLFSHKITHTFKHSPSMSLDHTSHHEMQEILYTVIKLFLLHEQMKKHERNWFFGQHNFSYVFLVLAMQSSVQSWTSYRRCSCCLISSLCDLSCVKDCIDSCLKDPVFF